jgi:microcystin-dependent protein
MQKLSRLKRDLWKGIKIGIGISIGFGFPTLLAVAVTGTFNSFTSGSLIRSSDINTNFATLKSAIEGIDLSSAVIPPGTIVAYGGNATPSGWLLCNGSTVSRITNSALYAAIGNNYGSGDGSTTFHLPDFRGRFLRGRDFSTGGDLSAGSRTVSNSGGNSGDAVGSLQTDAFQGHWHEVGEEGTSSVFRTASADFTGSTNIYARLSIGATRALGKTLLTDGVNGTPRSAPETRPINVYVNYIIKQ